MKSLFLIVLPFLFIACKTKIKPVDIGVAKLSMMEADRAFSKMSEEKGMKAAFLEYIDSNGVLLRPNTHPIIGGEAIYYITQGEDSTYSMTWDPQGGNVAQSGEMGFTYGIYSIKTKKDSSVQYGTYVSVWRRQPDGKWKFMLDTGNEGIGEVE
ncbi:MAG: nuclear transport factor 2 family protein [Bacteroidota bacterium]